MTCPLACNDDHACDELCGLPPSQSWGVKQAVWSVGPTGESRDRGFGPRRDPRSRRQRRLADVLAVEFLGYVAGGESRELACASIADVLMFDVL